jgi:hypothetical protein
MAQRANVAVTAQTIDFEVIKQEVLANEATFEGANAPTAEKMAKREQEWTFLVEISPT